MNRFGLFQHWLAKKISTQIICASHAIRHQIKTVIPDTLVIHDWVDTKVFDLKKFGMNPRTKYGISEKIVSIGMVGFLCPSKGIFMLYEAANVLLNKGRDCLFIYVGGFNKPLDRKLLLHKINKSGHNKAFRLTGWTTDVASAMAAMDVVVSPNLNAEGFGKTIIEAGAMQKPIVASNISPADELVVNKETGLLVEASNVGELVNAIEYLIDNPAERERIGENARRWVNTNFPKEKCINAILETINKVSNKMCETN
jgi:glycosyltransferase involved in cell wall biosynthesis